MFSRLRQFIYLIAVLTAGIISVPASGQSSKISSDAVILESEPVEFTFYGMKCELPGISGLNLPDAVGTQEEYTKLIDDLKWSRVAKSLIKYINYTANSANLNDYLTYRLLSDYVDALLPHAHNSVRAAFKQHIFDQMGFRTRLGLNPMGDGVVFLSFAQPVYDMKMVYDAPFRYYAIPDGDIDFSDEISADFTLLKLTSNAHFNRPVNLILNPLKIKNSPQKFEFTDGQLTINGEVNANLRDILYKYPRMNVDDVFNCTLQQDLRDTIVAQLKQQLDGKKQKEAVNTLLSFIQNAFPYQTDEELHGFEKPYFLEEMFLQPASDCEDRSILYSYLLKEVLGVPNVIIGYGDHVAVAVHLDNSAVRGAKIEVDGKDYYISDPTYTGARTGRVMPGYEDQTPEVYFKN